MSSLSPAGQQALADIAQRHGFSVDAARHMLDAIANGNGSMAQFSHAEFGGSGQWMSGGMTMVGDMFNSALKGRVAALCSDLSALLAKQPAADAAGTPAQYQRQGAGEPQAQGHRDDARMGSSAGQEPAHAEIGGSQQTRHSSDWWPSGLSRPDSTGSQNDMRYAVFNQQHRLAIDIGGKVTVYDIGDHRIGGVSQQQSSDRTVRFSSQHGPVDLDSLPVIESGTAAAR